MIVDFYDKGTEDVYNGLNTKKARKTLPAELWRAASRKFYFLDNAADIDDLKMPPGNHLESLKDDREGQYSVRINDQYRICFVWTENGPERVEITDYH
ncbi:MAG: plasmid maintenance system killer protein [Desulfobacteraceae bacterium]|nr:plasmid maintenance system killer protein [Desulfobacteraceae bacterium]